MDIKLENKTNETQAFRYYNVNLLQKLQPNEYVKLTTTDTTKDYYKTVAKESGITVNGGDTPVQPGYNKTFYSQYEGQNTLDCTITASDSTMSAGYGEVSIALSSLSGEYVETIDTQVCGIVVLESTQSWGNTCILDNITPTYLDELGTYIVCNVTYEIDRSVRLYNTVTLSGGDVYVTAYISHSDIITGAGHIQLTINNQSIYPIVVNNPYMYGPQISEKIQSYTQYNGVSDNIGGISATNAQDLMNDICNNITEDIQPVRDLYEVARYGESGADYDTESSNTLNFIIYGDNNDANYTEILASTTMLEGYVEIIISAVEGPSIDWQGSLPTSISGESSVSITTQDITPYDVDTWDKLSNYISTYWEEETPPEPQPGDNEYEVASFNDTSSGSGRIEFTVYGDSAFSDYTHVSMYATDILYSATSWYEITNIDGGSVVWTGLPNSLYDGNTIQVYAYDLDPNNVSTLQQLLQYLNITFMETPEPEP